MRYRVEFAFAVFATTLCLSAPAAADEQSAAAAETLFRDARRLVAEKRFAEACAKFAASQRLDSSLGTLYNLADCHEKEGKLASAWAEFVEAAGQAKKARDPREEIATRRATALEPRLVRLLIVVPEAHAVPGLKVTSDGTLLLQAAWGTGLPANPGEHQIEATAPGHVPWSTSVSLSEEGQTVTVEIPKLDEAPAPPVTPPPSAETTSGTPQHPSRVVVHHPLRALGWVVGSVGAASLAVGVGLGVAASSSWSRARQTCPEAGGQFVCASPSAEDTAAHSLSEARRFADGSTVALVAGGALALTGTIFILIQDLRPESTIQAAPWMNAETGGVSVFGHF